MGVLSNNASRGKVEAIPGSKSVSEGTFRSRSLELSSWEAFYEVLRDQSQPAKCDGETSLPQLQAHDFSRG